MRPAASAAPFSSRLISPVKWSQKKQQPELMPLMANLQKMKKLQFASLVIVFVFKQTSLSSYPALIQSLIPLSPHPDLSARESRWQSAFYSWATLTTPPTSLSVPRPSLARSLSTLRLGGCVCGTQQLQEAPSSLFVDKRDGAPVSAESLDED